MALSKFIYLSYNLAPHTPCPVSLPMVILKTIYSVETDGANVYEVSFTSHSGTHVDAPGHMVFDGLRICDFVPEDFIFTRPLIINMCMQDSELVRVKQLRKYENELALCDLLLIKSGWGKYREADKERYINRNPGFSTDAAAYINESFPSLKAIGMDFLSLAAAEHVDEGIEAHKILFKGNGGRFLIFEDMNLSYDLVSLKKVIAMPWFVEGIDSSPCTILGEL